MPAIAAGVFRRTPIERSDQRVSWERPDEAFFAAGACHILAWECRDAFPDRPIELVAMFLAGRAQPMHVYARWDDRAFDASGWNAESEVLRVNADFEGRPVTGVRIATGLAEFCAAHVHRMPEHYWRDPRPRAREYLSRFPPPWLQG